MLIVSVINQSFDVFQFLISRGVNTKLKDNEGRNALHYAVLKKNYKMIFQLLVKKTPFKIKDNQNKTAINLAEETKDPSIMGLFIN